MNTAVKGCRSGRELHLHVVYLGFPVPDAARTDGIQLLLFAPIAAHVDELRVLVKQFRQLLYVFLCHPIPFAVRQIDYRLFFGCKYRFSGPDLDKNRVGEVVNQVSAKVGDAVGQVRDEFKREFDKSRGKKGK